MLTRISNSCSRLLSFYVLQGLQQIVIVQAAQAQLDETEQEEQHSSGTCQQVSVRSSGGLSISQIAATPFDNGHLCLWSPSLLGGEPHTIDHGVINHQLRRSQKFTSISCPTFKSAKRASSLYTTTSYRELPPNNFHRSHLSSFTTIARALLQVAGSHVTAPLLQQPKGIVHLLGGAFAGAAPQLAYQFLINWVANAGYTVVATPYAVTFRHLDCAARVHQVMFFHGTQ